MNPLVGENPFCLANLLPGTKSVALALAFIAGILLCGVLVALLWFFNTLRKNHPQFASAVASALSAFAFIWCTIQTYLWAYRQSAKKAVRRAIFLIFLLAGFFTVLELLLKLSGYTPLDNILSAVRDIILSVDDHPWALVALLLVEVLILVHHVGEHRRSRRIRSDSLTLLKVLGPLKHSLATADDSPSNGNAIPRFRTLFAAEFVDLYAKRGIKKVDVTIMRFDRGKNLLKIVFSSSSDADRFDHNFTLQPDQGAAGKAFSTRNPIYIPSISYRHGIEVLDDAYRVLIDAYYPSRKHPFRSMVCVPIVDSMDRTMGVLNFSSPQKDAFSPIDIGTAVLAAGVLGLIDA